MHVQKQEQKIKTIDLIEYLDGFHNYRTIANERESIKCHPFAKKLRHTLQQRAQTCFSIQTVQPQIRNSHRQIATRNHERQEHHYEDQQPEEINIAQFMQVVVSKQKKEIGDSKAHQFIRSLNGTWFQGTEENFKCSKIYNTLGIKKSRSLVRPKSQRYNPQQVRDRIDFTKEAQISGLFPSRRPNTQAKKRTVKNIVHSHAIKGNQGTLKYQIMKAIKQQIQGHQSPQSHMKLLKSNYATTSFNNQKINNNINKQTIVKGAKMIIYK